MEKKGGGMTEVCKGDEERGGWGEEEEGGDEGGERGL